jgi:hypothetical protein
VDDPAVTWLWRALREAEAAGLDSAGVLERAVASGPLADAESVAKVLDWRVRQHTAGMLAVAARSWADQVRPTGDPDTDRYWRELAEAMADRQRRLGEHTAEHPPAWAQALGPVPEHPVDRADWEHKAGLVGKYRERWGYAHPYEPIGPKPGQHSPDARQDWQAAAEALSRQPGDLSEYSDGQLWVWRSMFAREMEWAPPYKGDDLATVRAAIRRAEIDADRAHRNAQAATSDEARQRLESRAGMEDTWLQMTRDLAAQLAEVQAGYDAWETTVTPTLDRALAADAELRRRHPDRPVEPLRARPPAEPDPERIPGQPASAEPRTASPEASEPSAMPDLAPHSGKVTGLQQQVQEISARLDEAVILKAQQAREKAAEITSMSVPSDDPDAAPAIAWIDDIQAQQRHAVRHSPMPRVPQAEAIQAAAEPGISDPEPAH